MRNTFVISIVGLLLSTCASIPSEKVDELADKLIVVSQKAEGKIRYSDAHMNSIEMKSYITKKHPRIYSYFEGYSLEFQIKGKHVIALLCDVNHSFTIAEDSACTPQIDRKYYLHDVPCGFSLNASEICKFQ